MGTAECDIRPTKLAGPLAFTCAAGDYVDLADLAHDLSFASSDTCSWNINFTYDYYLTDGFLLKSSAITVSTDTPAILCAPTAAP